eukprot:UN23420
MTSQTVECDLEIVYTFHISQGKLFLNSARTYRHFCALCQSPTWTRMII